MSALPPKADIAAMVMSALCYKRTHALQQFCRYSITRVWHGQAAERYGRAECIGDIQEEIFIDKDFKFAAVQRL
jgi:hypothetical protein